MKNAILWLAIIFLFLSTTSCSNSGEYSYEEIREKILDGNIVSAFKMQKADKHLSEDRKTDDTYEIVRSSNMVSLLTQIIDSYSEAEIENIFSTSYEDIISYLEYVTKHAGSHSTVIAPYMHCLDEMKNTEKIDMMLNIIKENNPDIYLDILHGVCVYKNEHMNNYELFEYFYEILEQEYEVLGKEISKDELHMPVRDYEACI